MLLPFLVPVLSLSSKDIKQTYHKLPLRSLPWLNGSRMVTSLPALERPRAKLAGHFQGGIIAVV